MRILVLNSGSSTVKFEVVETDAEKIRTDSDVRLARGLVDPIGGPGRFFVEDLEGKKTEERVDVPDHRAAVERVLEFLAGCGAGGGGSFVVDAVGHRVVHGGERFRKAVRIDDEVIAGIEAVAVLAPLHNPANLRGIRAVRDALGPDVPQVAVFDTAFHATLPAASAVYAIPREYRERLGIRRYGFHGISHRYLSERACRLLGARREEVNLVTLHLGNGCSACAIRRGVSVETSMGLTPLEGLVMGTRSGDLDPSILELLFRQEHLGPGELDEMLNHRSGLLGISGVSSDMRDLLRSEREEGNPEARLAIEVFCHRVRKYVGAYFAVLGGATAVVFSGGIGENSPEIRSRIAAGLPCLGLELDPRRNAETKGGAEGEIGAEGAPLRALVIPTDEELVIARDTYRVVSEGH